MFNQNLIFIYFSNILLLTKIKKKIDKIYKSLLFKLQLNLIFSKYLKKHLNSSQINKTLNHTQDFG